MSEKSLTEEQVEDARDYLTEIAVPSTSVRNTKGQWVKGVSGNAKPVPDKVDLTEILREQLGIKGARRLANTLINLATGSKPVKEAIFYIYDRLEGKPRQQIIESRAEDDPLLELVREVQEFNASKDALAGQTVTSLAQRAVESSIEGEVREITGE